MLEKHLIEYLESTGSMNVDSFNAICRQSGNYEMSIAEFASKAGMYLVAKTMQPDDIEGFLRTVMTIPPTTSSIIADNSLKITARSGCGSCGGGTVR